MLVTPVTAADLVFLLEREYGRRERLRIGPAVVPGSLGTYPRVPRRRVSTLRYYRNMSPSHHTSELDSMSAVIARVMGSQRLIAQLQGLIRAERL